MSTPNFRTQDNFPLYAKDYSEFYVRCCNECGVINNSEVENCDECGEPLPDAVFDEIACQDFYDDINAELNSLNNDFNFHRIEIISGYYTGAQLYVEKSDTLSRAYVDSPEELDNDDCQYYFGMCRSRTIRAYEAEQRKVRQTMAKLAANWGFEEYVCGGIFSNGEAIYYKVGTVAAAANSVA